MVSTRRFDELASQFRIHHADRRTKRKNEEGGQFSNQYFAIVCSACCVCQIVKDLFRIEEKTPAKLNWRVLPPNGSRAVLVRLEWKWGV